MPISAMHKNKDFHIPSGLQDFLKEYAKAAIKTQPKDILKWSYLYFDALATGRKPPARRKYDGNDDQDLITIQLIRLIHEYVSSCWLFSHKRNI